jgi:hypothetical protein
MLDDDLKPSAQKTTMYADSKLKDDGTKIREQACADIVKTTKERKKKEGDKDKKSEPGTLSLDTEDCKQTRRTEQKEEEVGDNFGQVESGTPQTSLPEEGTLLRERSFSRIVGRAIGDTEKEVMIKKNVTTKRKLKSSIQLPTTTMRQSPKKTIDYSCLVPGAKRISGNDCKKIALAVREEKERILRESDRVVRATIVNVITTMQTPR